ncbi:MAG: 4Fe-4S ferredoxin [Deltaproteobacteria bacterium]|nr:4Fe-4S ferredoxin [Deltaproteobacteria bacterium]
MALRTVVQIDEEKCDGCGLCVPGCAEGALQIVDGKARLVSDIYCDGLGACLGECPQDAITLVDRDAARFDEEAVAKHLKSLSGPESTRGRSPENELPHEEPEPSVGGCPGSLSQAFDERPAASPGPDAGNLVSVASRLGNWPVQITLTPLKAPFFDQARLIIAADCVPFAYGDFHRRFLEERALLIGCPKLDDTGVYLEKLTEIFRQNDLRSIEVVHMEVPCCSGLVQLVKQALEASGKDIPTTLYRVGVKGDFVEENILGGATAWMRRTLSL